MSAYGITFILGSFAGLIWLGWGLPRVSARDPANGTRIEARQYLEAGLWSLGAGLIGARIAFAIAHWGYYSSRMAEVLWFGQGGLSWVGGAVGGFTGLGIYAAAYRLPFWQLSDEMALPADALALACWVGCLMEGCAYGIKLQDSIFASPMPDLLGTLALRWPTQTLGALYSLVLLLGAFWFRNRLGPPGALAFINLGLLSAGSLALSFARADPVAIWAGLRLEALGAIALLAIALVVSLLRLARL